MCRNYAKLWIEYSTFHDIVGSAIVLRSTGGGTGARIRYSRFFNVSGNGVIAKAGNHNVEIYWNIFDNVGSTDKLHPIYVIAPDALIEYNKITGTRGDGVTMRSSGIVRNNQIRGTGKSAIKYFSDGVPGLSDTVIFENNDCGGSGLGHAVIALQAGGGQIVSRYVLKGNHMPYAPLPYSFGTEFSNKLIELS